MESACFERLEYATTMRFVAKRTYQSMYVGIRPATTSSSTSMSTSGLRPSSVILRACSREPPSSARVEMRALR